MNVRAILFDLDGTLTDTGEGVINSAKYALEQLKIPFPPEPQFRRIVGPPLAEGFSYLGVPEKQYEDAIRIYREMYNNRGAKYQNRIYDGVVELLAQLKDQGYRLFVATSKPEPLALDVLGENHLAGWFEMIAGASFDHSRETKSSVLKYLLDRIGHREEAVLIGDTRYDVLGAKELGIPCVGVSWGFGTREELEQAGAAAVIDRPQQLPAVLRDLSTIH